MRKADLRNTKLSPPVNLNICNKPSLQNNGKILELKIPAISVFGVKLNKKRRWIDCLWGIISNSIKPASQKT